MGMLETAARLSAYEILELIKKKNPSFIVDIVKVKNKDEDNPLYMADEDQVEWELQQDIQKIIIENFTP